MLVGVDTGGTFTDFVALWPDGRCRVHKRRSTPADPARAVIDGLHHLLGEEVGEADLTYGSTVATNAVLERKGARVVLATTAGFEDLLEIARQTRLDIYSLSPRRARPLVPRSLRLGVDERVDYDGSILHPLNKRTIEALCNKVADKGAASVAVCLLHSYANGRHEELIATALRAQGVACSVSHELVPEHREYERLSTTVANAYVAPVMEKHLSRLAAGAAVKRLRVLQSSGGAIAVDTAGREAVRTLLSGPAGGVVGAQAAARRIGVSRILTLDMGGTSTDVSLVNGEVRRRTQWSIDGLPVKVPAIDIHTVGAGGGSIVRVDEGGALKVGPRSAGAEPGPACYGRGSLPTVTDANLLLGRLVADAFLGGEMPIDTARAARAMSIVAAELEVRIEEAAEGVVRVVNASMERAIRKISIEVGYDPRDYVLVSFGGAAGMHACQLAEGLEMKRVLVPRYPGLLSAWGAMAARIERSYVKTICATDRLVDSRIDVDDGSPLPAKLKSEMDSLLVRARAELRRESPDGEPLLRASADVRYCGQSYEIEIPLRGELRADFEREHERLYGYSDAQRSIEVVNLRIVGFVDRPDVAERSSPRRRSAARSHSLWWNGSEIEARHLTRTSLPRQRRIAGPLVVSELSATTVVPPGWCARVAKSGDLLVEKD